MSIIENSFKQHDDEWYQARLGNIGASSMNKIITSQGKPSKQIDDYLLTLACEKIRGAADENYQSKSMINGNIREEEARILFELIYDVEVEQCAMVYKDKKKLYHASPDGLIGKDGGLEIKAPLAKTHAKYLLANKVPSEYFVQIQSSLYISERKYWYFMSYCSGMRPLIIRVERDEVFLAKLKTELKLFCLNLNETINKIK